MSDPHNMSAGNKDELKCGVCGQLADSVLKFLQHKTTHVGRGVGRGCEICQLAFSRQAALCEHYKRKHSIFFDTMPDSTIENVKRELKERAKVIKEKKKFTKAKIPLTESLVQQTTTTVNLPNGAKLDVVVENNDLSSAVLNSPVAVSSGKIVSENLKFNGTVSLTGNVRKSLIGPSSTRLADEGTLLGTTYLNATKTVTVSTATTEATVLTSAASFTDSPSLTSSPALTGSSTFIASTSLTDTLAVTSSSTLTTANSLTGSKTLTGSLTGTQALTGSSTFAGSASLCSPAALPDSTAFNSSTSLVNFCQLQNTGNNVVLGINEDTAMIGNNPSKATGNEMEKLRYGTKYIIVRSLIKPENANDITGSHLLVTNEVIDKNKSEQDVTLPKKDIFIEGKLDNHSVELFHNNEKESNNVVSSEVDSVINNSVDAPENDSFVDIVNNDLSAGKPEFESKISDESVLETENNENVEANMANTSVCLKQIHVYSTRNFKRKGKLNPVTGKIPQELDMPDFYFLNIVKKSGTHMKNMHVGKDQFKCLFCTAVTKWRGNMCRHMREMHSGLLESGAALIMPLQLSSKDGKVLKMTEYIQMEMAKRPNKRRRGVESQDMPGDYPCEQCGKVFNRLRYLRMHLQQHKLKKDLLCALCSKTFKTKNNLNQHLKTHEEREPYKCPDCDFESAVNIAIHKHRQIHNANSLLCDICGQAYSDKSTLKKHKQVHDPSRPWGCTIPGCTWRFRTQVMCDAHIQGHGSKPTFKCDICGYAFRQKHHLQRHEKVVHNIVHEPKPYRPYYNNPDSDFNENQFENIPTEERNEMEVSQGVNLIINEGNMSNVITTDHFDLESALQSGQLVIAADDGSINYEMSDIGSNVVYQTFLPDGEVQQFETQTVSISQSDAGQMTYEGVETIQSEVEIEQS